MAERFSPRPETYRSYLRAIADSGILKRVVAKADASDIVQETMLKACAAADQFNGSTEAEYRAWLCAIMTNVCLGVLRGYQAGKRDWRLERSLQEAVRSSSGCLNDFLAAVQSSPSQQGLRAHKFERLLSAVEELPADQQTSIRLHHLEGLSLVETATQMERTRASVAGLLRRGLAALRISMCEEQMSR